MGKGTAMKSQLGRQKNFEEKIAPIRSIMAKDENETT